MRQRDRRVKVVQYLRYNPERGVDNACVDPSTTSVMTLNGVYCSRQNVYTTHVY